MKKLLLVLLTLSMLLGVTSNVFAEGEETQVKLEIEPDLYDEPTFKTESYTLVVPSSVNLKDDENAGDGYMVDITEIKLNNVDLVEETSLLVYGSSANDLKLLNGSNKDPINYEIYFYGSSTKIETSAHLSDKYLIANMGSDGIVYQEKDGKDNYSRTVIFSASKEDIAKAKSKSNHFDTLTYNVELNHAIPRCTVAVLFENGETQNINFMGQSGDYSWATILGSNFENSPEDDNSRSVYVKHNDKNYRIDFYIGEPEKNGATYKLYDADGVLIKSVGNNGVVKLLGADGQQLNVDRNLADLEMITSSAE